MNRTKRLAEKIGFVFGGALIIGALTGCPPYQEQPRQGGAYYETAGPEGAVSAEIRTEGDFYEPLSPYGRWEVVGSYGRCWIPGGVDADWSPYSNGYWQQTDAGWYWASDEPWGWATYHYGRWDRSPQYGWYWVPQTQWAPSWVSWRQGNGYVGWAPLGPSGRVGAGGGTSQGYVFVEERRFLEPVRFKTVIVNNTVFNRTADITRTHTVDKTMVNEGPRAAVIERASGHKIQAVPVRELRSREEAKVITRHPPSTSTGVKNVQAPIRTQAAPPEKRVVPAREPRQVEKPAVTKPAPPPPAARRVVPPAVPPEKRVIPAREPGQVEKPAVTRAAPPPPAARNVQPAPERNAAIQGQKEPKAVEKRPGQPAGRAVEPGKQAPPAAKPPAKQEQAASKPGQKNAPEEDHQQKDQN